MFFESFSGLGSACLDSEGAVGAQFRDADLSVRGGTGSGFECLLLEPLSVGYGKKPTVWDWPKVATTIAELCDTVLCSDSVPEHTGVTVMMDMKALYDVCHRY